MVLSIESRRPSDTSWLEIDLSALDWNYHAFKHILAPGAQIAAVVKADAYGLGAVRVARRLVSRGVSMLIVYDHTQAAELVKAGINCDLMILMPVEKLERTDVLYRTAIAGKLHLTVHSLEQAERVEQTGQKFGCPIRIHIELDTGMSRAGMHESEASTLLKSMKARRYLKLAGLFTHASSADENVRFTEIQHDRFQNFLRRHADVIGPEAKIHFAGTHAALRDQRYHKSMLRLGLGLLGYGQSELGPGTIISEMPELKPTLRWMSRVVHTLDVPTGTPVGYGGQFVTQRRSRLAIVPAGYADGYPAALANRGVVRVGEALRPAPVRGKINMDQLIIDVTDIADAGCEMPVEIISNDPQAPNALPVLAARAGTHCYELLCRLNQRLTRRYLTTEASTGRVGQVAVV